MNQITHFLTGWCMTLPIELERRDRALVVLASIVPDIDGIVLLGDITKGHKLDSLELWGQYHHVLAHNIGFVLGFSILCLALARKRILTGALAFLALNVHLACDVIGSRGPDGGQWPVPYLLPFSNSWQLTVSWQWALNAWPNVLITILLLCLTFWMAWARGFSPVGLFSAKADQAFVRTLRGRFGHPSSH
jgi:hypothetical protein